MNKQPLTTVDALNKTLESPPLDPVMLAIANDYLSGRSVETIAEEYDLPQDRITSVIEQREVKAYIDLNYDKINYDEKIDTK